MSLQIEIVTSRQRFQAVKPSWDALWTRVGGDVFRWHGWISTWLEGCGSSFVPHIALAWQGNELVAALPLVVRHRWGLRTLEWCAQALSDYCDALVLPEHVADLPQVWNAATQARGFDVLNLQQVRPDAAIRCCLDTGSGMLAGPTRRASRAHCLAIDCVCQSSEAWFRSLGKKGRNNFWRGERLLASIGGDIAYHCADPATQPIDTYLQRLFELKHAWLHARRHASPLLTADGRVLQAMLRAAVESGRVRLFMVTSGGRMAAASVNFLQSDTLQAYMTGYDPEFERASPGMLLLVHYVRWAYDRGLTQVDLLRGNEPFKVKLATSATLLNCYNGARTLLGTAAHAAQNGKLQLRHVIRPDVDLNPVTPHGAMLRGE